MGYIKEIRELVGSKAITLNSSCMIIKNNKEEILLLHRTDTNNWGLPGGYMEPGETFQETIEREIKEELGINIKKMAMIDLLSGKEYYHEYPNGDKVYSVIALYEARERFEDIPHVDHKEIDNAKFFNKDTIPNEVTEVTIRILNI